MKKIHQSESRIDAEAANGKGRSPFHVLAKFTDTNTRDIFSTFLEFMPEYPLDKPDTEGIFKIELKLFILV